MSSHPFRPIEPAAITSPPQESAVGAAVPRADSLLEFAGHFLALLARHHPRTCERAQLDEMLRMLEASGPEGASTVIRVAAEHGDNTLARLSELFDHTFTTHEQVRLWGIATDLDGLANIEPVELFRSLAESGVDSMMVALDGITSSERVVEENRARFQESCWLTAVRVNPALALRAALSRDSEQAQILAIEAARSASNKHEVFLLGLQSRFPRVLAAALREIEREYELITPDEISADPQLAELLNRLVRESDSNVQVAAYHVARLIPSMQADFRFSHAASLHPLPEIRFDAYQRYGLPSKDGLRDCRDYLTRLALEWNPDYAHDTARSALHVLATEGGSLSAEWIEKIVARCSAEFGLFVLENLPPGRATTLTTLLKVTASILDRVPNQEHSGFLERLSCAAGPIIDLEASAAGRTLRYQLASRRVSERKVALACVPLNSVDQYAAEIIAIAADPGEVPALRITALDLLRGLTTTLYRSSAFAAARNALESSVPELREVAVWLALQAAPSPRDAARLLGTLARRDTAPSVREAARTALEQVNSRPAWARFLGSRVMARISPEPAARPHLRASR